MKNIVTIAAIAALATLTACNKTENIQVPADESAAANIELNDDGTVKQVTDNISVTPSSIVVEGVGKPADEHIEATK